MTRKVLAQRCRRATAEAWQQTMRLETSLQRATIEDSILHEYLDGVLVLKHGDALGTQSGEGSSEGPKIGPKLPPYVHNKLRFKTMLRAALSPMHLGLKSLQECCFGGHVKKDAIARARVVTAAVTWGQSIYAATACAAQWLYWGLCKGACMASGRINRIHSVPALGMHQIPLGLSVNWAADGTPHPAVVKKEMNVPGCGPVTVEAKGTDCFSQRLSVGIASPAPLIIRSQVVKVPVPLKSLGSNSARTILEALEFPKLMDKLASTTSDE